MRRPAGLLLLLLAAAPASGAELLHGGDSTFVSRGVVVLWGVLRGSDEASTRVVLRVARADGAHGAIAVDGVDPFTGRRATVLPPTRLAERQELRLPRARFADYPRTEIHLAESLEALRARGPALTIYFTGVPDTTPELPTEAALDAYFEGALARVRAR